ncbi:HCP family protein with MYND-type zinc finger protein [Medicago truncatula]|nr:HCP family protein with MYND-type zinc finger protein [Medicago truncatula]
MKLHAPALYSLAVIQFNGSGGTKQDKDLRAGVALSARASLLGHIDALRELGHCLQDGYGVKQNVTEGRRLLVQANVREILLVYRFLELASPSRAGSCEGILSRLSNMAVPLIKENRYNVKVPEVHPVNWFLREWFESGLGILEDGLRLCAHIGCGRAETRPHEFRRCSVCGISGVISVCVQLVQIFVLFSSLKNYLKLCYYLLDASKISGNVNSKTCWLAS